MANQHNIIYTKSTKDNFNNILNKIMLQCTLIFTTSVTLKKESNQQLNTITIAKV
jgi:hypothetical protein